MKTREQIEEELQKLRENLKSLSNYHEPGSNETGTIIVKLMTLEWVLEDE